MHKFLFWLWYLCVELVDTSSWACGISKSDPVWELQFREHSGKIVNFAKIWIFKWAPLSFRLSFFSFFFPTLPLSCERTSNRAITPVGHSQSWRAIPGTSPCPSTCSADAACRRIMPIFGWSSPLLTSFRWRVSHFLHFSTSWARIQAPFLKKTHRFVGFSKTPLSHRFLAKFQPPLGSP